MNDKLSATHIEELFAFCRRHYVHYYDVQVELVDHLANAIEDNMASDANLTFEQALNDTYKGFGYNGFAGVIAAKTETLTNRNKQLRRKIFFAYFTPPKLFFSILLAAGLISLGNLVGSKQLPSLIAIIMCLFGLLEIILAIKSNRLFRNISQKLLLIETKAHKVFFSFPGMQIAFQFISFSDKHIILPVYYYLVAIIISLMTMFSLSYYDMCKKLLGISRKEYPEVFAK